MYRNELDDIPQEVKWILERLDEIEKDILEEPGTCERGEDIIGRAFRDRNIEGSINVIPGGKPGKCHTSLLVAIGRRTYEDIEKRILQAADHIHTRCPGVTQFVIFWAVKWDYFLWMSHASSFRGVITILKPFGARPTVLT